MPEPIKVEPNVDKFEFDTPPEEIAPSPKDEGTITPKEEEDSPTVKLALSEGWIPKEDFTGDEDSWVEAKEFVFRGELMDRIKKQSGVINSLSDQTKDLKDALKVLGEHNKKLADIEYKKALSTLKKEKIDALEESDHQAVLDIDEQIDELKEAKIETKEIAENQEKETENLSAPPEIVSWLSNKENDWFNTDLILRGATDAIAADYLKKNPEDFAGMLKYIDKEIRKEFPSKFGITKPSSTAVSTPNGRGKSAVSSKGKKFTPRNLSEEQYSVGKTFVNQGIYKNMQEWVDALVDTDQL